MQEHLFTRGDYPLSRLGLDPSQPLYDLNLAGTQGVPSPQMLTQPAHTPELLLPDFGTQNYDVPPVQPYDLTGPGITYMPEFAADPALPDLDAYTHPYDVNITAQGTDTDTQLAHVVPSQAEITDSLYPGLGFTTLNVHSDVSAIDPLVPDLQNPDLTQQVQRPVDERPGDLASPALDVLHTAPDYQPQTRYPESWLSQQGVNTTRSRHMSLLDDGLEQ